MATLQNVLLTTTESGQTAGVGLIITEMVSIDSSKGKRGVHQLRIDEEAYIEGLSQLTQEIHKSSTKIAIQLCHAGIFAGAGQVGFHPVAPSPINVFGKSVTRELTVIEIDEIITHFVEAALRAKEANFDGVEIHAAHAYLLAYFFILCL